MRKTTLFMAMLTLIAGCQTDAQVRIAAPLDKYQSSKSPNDALACLIPSIEKSYNAVAIERFRFVAQAILPNAEYDIVPTTGLVNGHYLFSVNVKKSGSGSTISLYRGQFVIASLTQGMKDGIKGCI